MIFYINVRAQCYKLKGLVADLTLGDVSCSCQSEAGMCSQLSPST